MEEDEIIKCTECNSREITLDNNRGELYCENCGVVLDDELLEETSAGKEKTGDPNSAMTHSKNREGYILGSEVGMTNLDGSIDRSRRGKTLRRMNTRNKMTSYEKNVSKGLILCNMLCAEFQLGQEFRDQVIWKYKKLQKDGILSGLSLEARAAAIVYFTFKSNGISRTLGEVCDKNSSHPRQVARAARKIAKHFRQPWVLSQRNVPQEVQKYCSKLQTHHIYTSNAVELAVKMHEIAEAKYVTTNAGFTAACIYLSQQLAPTTSFRTQGDISDVCNITEVTLRNNMLEILKMLNLTREDLQNLTLEEFIEGAYERAGKR